MNKKHLRITVILICLIAVGGLWLISSDFMKKEEGKIEIVEFDNKMPQFNSSYYIDAYNKNSTDLMKSSYTILIENTEDPIYVEFAQVGSSAEVRMKIYFDFMPVEFKVGDANFALKYDFEVEDGMKIKFPVYLGKGVNLSDEKTHKLFITFTSIPNEHILDYNQTTDFYGTNAVYDITNLVGSDYSNDLEQGFTKIYPENNFEETFGTFILNTDYDNSNYKINKGIAVTDPSITAKKDTVLPMMYNFDKLENIEEALLLLTVGGEICNRTIVMLDGKEGVANGQIDIKVPEEKGLYEVIAYIIYDPFNQVTMDNHLAESSYRFTLKVE